MNPSPPPELAAALWPGCEVGAAVATPRRGGREYLALPSVDQPRLLLPAGDRRAAVQGITAFRRTARGRLLAALTCCGLLPLLRSPRIRVGAGEGFEDALSRALGSGLLAAVHLGPPRANRKPVLLLLGPQGHAVGYAKLAVDRLTARLVREEAAALRTLRTAHLPGITVPLLLHFGQFDGRPYFVQQALPLPAATARPGTSRLLRCVTRIASMEPLRRRWLSGGPYLPALRSRVDRLAPHPLTTPLRQALAALPDVEIMLGAWHGDLTRWNLACASGRDYIWDWERLGRGYPVGFDALHYRLDEALSGDLQTGMRRWLAQAPTLLSAPLLGRSGVAQHPRAVHTVMALYLVELAVRYVADRQCEAGGRRAAVEQWLMPALHTLVARART